MQEGQPKVGQCRKAEWITGCSAPFRQVQGGCGSHSPQFEMLSNRIGNRGILRRVKKKKKG